ncbi:hypothetical protein COOONC_04965 [Cooperia oncophora]
MHTEYSEIHFTVVDGNVLSITTSFAFVSHISEGVLITEGCSQIVSMKAHEETCLITDGIESCTFNEAMLISLQPLQQETCITLKDHDSHPLGIVSMKVNGIQFQCRKNIEFFTRDHHLTSESVHRCYSAGSCKEDACENTSATDKIKEFSFTANNSPGYTFCSQSCGCLTCDGCFFCQPSCLFYRIFAVPTTTTVLIGNNCSTTTNISVDIRRNGLFHLNCQTCSSRTAHTSQHWTIAMLYNSTQICSTVRSPIMRANALNGLHKASCVCSPGSVADLMLQSPLPQTSKNYIIFSDNKNVFAKINVGSALQIHFVAENMKVTSRQSNSTCTIEASDLIGCYSCIAGAELTLYCQSTNIECPFQTQIARCTPTGYINTLKFHFDTSTVSTECKASCPGGITPFTMKGSLHYVDDNLIKSDLHSEGESRDVPMDTTFLEDLSSKVNNFINKITSLFPSNFIVNTLLYLLLTFFAIQFFYRTVMLYVASKFSKKDQ